LAQNFGGFEIISKYWKLSRRILSERGGTEQRVCCSDPKQQPPHLMKLSPILTAIIGLLSAAISPCQAQNRNTVPLFTVPLGAGSGELCASGDYAYVARGMSGVEVVKINGPGSPAKVGTIRPYPGSANICISDVQIVGSTLYVGNDVPNGSPTPHTGLFMFDLTTDPINPLPVGTISWGEFAMSYVGASAHAICINQAAGRTYAYIASSISNVGVVFDVTNPAAPEYKANLMPQLSSGLVPGTVHDIAVKNGKSVTTYSTGGFTIHDVSNIAASGIDWQTETLINTTVRLNTTKYANALTYHAAFSDDGNTLITVDGRYYIGCRTWNLASITSPNVPMIHSAQYTSATTAFMHNVHVDGKYIYLSNFMDGCRILELQPGGLLADMGRYDTTPTTAGGGSSGVWGVFVAGDKVLLGDTVQGLVAIDFRDTIAVPQADWKHGTRTLTVQCSSTAAPSVNLSVAGFGPMTWNSNTGKYQLVLGGVNVNPGTITVTSSIGGSQTASVRRR
jgi:hypothetical protein